MEDTVHICGVYLGVTGVIMWTCVIDEIQDVFTDQIQDGSCS
jgi:hypothetical protein